MKNISRLSFVAMPVLVLLLAAFRAGPSSAAINSNGTFVLMALTCLAAGAAFLAEKSGTPMDKTLPPAAFPVTATISFALITPLLAGGVSIGQVLMACTLASFS